MEKINRIFAFDLGTGSIGECVREGNTIKHLESLLLPPDYAATKEQSKRRRQYRTRLAHKERENWWHEQAKIAGIEVLESSQPTKENPDTKPDPRLLREFSANGDKIIYTSCLLRIALLRGIKLESWQIYKAIWSALQHRGYDANPSWKKNHERNVSEDNSSETETVTEQENQEKEDEAENIKAIGEYKKLLVNYFGDGEEFHYPCYYEAYRMGIWDPKQPDKLDGKSGSNPPPARNKDEVKAVAPRDLVEKELRGLLEQAAIQYPKLKGRTNHILYGHAGKPYASCKSREGILGQKAPRFDNRIISKCALIPRLNVCKANDELNQDVTFLMQLKNMRYFDCNNKERALTPPEEISEFFQRYKTTGRADWSRWVKTKLQGTPNPTQPEIKKPKIGGRSRFCRPALRILRELLLSGVSPHTKHLKLIASNHNTDPKKGLVNTDYDFLLGMPAEWQNFAIPDQRAEDANLYGSNRIDKIHEIINGINNPVIRHRLRLLVNRLNYLKNNFGEPYKVVLELVRDSEEGFMGKKRKKEWEQTQKRNQKMKDDAYNAIKDSNLAGQKALLKMMLYEEQGGFDFYSLEPLICAELNNYEIDHIVPRAKGGSDAYLNKILTTHSNNMDKGDKTPYEWLHDTDKWKGFLEKIKTIKLHPKKKALLTSENASELVEKYTALASTAYMSKLAQRIVALFFGWPLLTKGSERKITVANGGHTAKIRRRYGLDRILHLNKTAEEFKKLVETGEIDKKNRDNPRHHALDALVISMLPELKFNTQTGNDELPVWFNRIFCQDVLQNVQPRHVNFQKPTLAETLYGLRKYPRQSIHSKTYVVITTAKTSKDKPTRLKDWENLSVEQTKKRSKKIYSTEIRQDFEQKLSSNPNPEEWRKFVQDYKTKNGSIPKKIAYIESDDIKPESNGNPPKIFGEFAEIGKMEGQYLKNKKEYKGQLVYRNEKGKWKVEPVTAFDSLYRKKNEFKKLSKEVYFFRSKQLINIKNACNNNKILPGIYRLKTLKSNGETKLEKTDGPEIPGTTMINILMNEGQMRIYMRVVQV